MAEEEVILKENSGGGSGFSRDSGKEEAESGFEEVKPKKWYEDSKFIFILAVLLGILLFLIVVLMFLYSQNKTPANVIIPSSVEAGPIQTTDESLKFEADKIDGMIQKANALYLKGEREQALKVYEQIALYSEALSNYNLGVSQMNQKNFTQALQSFQRAIQSNENQTVAAINAAVCALYLGDQKQFDYYLDLALVYLPNEGDSELFEYYLSLINYYKGFYPEALQSFQKVQVEHYADESKFLSAKIYAKMGLNTKSIENLQNQGSYEVSLPLGLLYARMGRYGEAKTNLERAMKIERDFNQSLAALSFIDLKIGKYQDMLERLNALVKGNEHNILKTNKIKVSLKKELTSIQIAQDNFIKDFLKDKKEQADILFYFAPYQVFDAKEAANYINKANVSSFLQDDQGGDSYLMSSHTLSSTNVKLARIISHALEHKLSLANEEFKNLLQTYKEHSILQYNLALSYAQLQNYDLAFKHFSTAYHINPKNYAAGAFAILAGSLSDKDILKLQGEILDNINTDDNFDQQLYQNIMFFANNESSTMLSYLDSEDNSSFSLIFKAIIAKMNNLPNEFDKDINLLKQALNDDILVNILYFNAKNSNLNIKEYAQNAQIYFKDSELDYRALAGGARVVRDSYVSLMRVVGLLNQKREFIKQKLAIKDEDQVGLTSTLAYMDIYAGLYGEAYALYDTLINDYKVKDSMTYFLAAVAAIGSNNPNAAIALLELSKLEDTGNQESRVALGLLYHEVQNYEPALYQYQQIKNDFQSKFFTFDILKTP
ncbi:hypothetical protein DMB92_00120 [Campylobacter sp. MIT 99-7217]|uniref:tetratricopeptide repeat protein n=1 Tax=Campylobacter sp. MIT 99-7217 TaxID=535091 RepID=UPI00115B84A1|nr:tetratricopeptide repeat protein [Campylobacter sp. MIT 99-7217]TQR34411.1 hypothetical protein DMB92_00120 [Campylobacter sp. MIT 99-7217]